MTTMTTPVMTPAHTRDSTWLDLLIIFVCWGLGVAIANPIGNFPLNDDWSFAQSVKILLDTGKYIPTKWGAMTMFTHIVWGTLFCLPFGFSFNALRASTLTASLAGVLGVYFIAKELGLARRYRIIAALILAFNPIYLALSNTFMTDVLFTALLILSTLFFVRCLKTDSNADCCFGAALALAATMSRQVGVVIPVSFAIAYLFMRGFTWRGIVKILPPILICAIALVAYDHWLFATDNVAASYAQRNNDLKIVLRHPIYLLQREAYSTFVSLLYFGLFLIPAFLILAPAVWREHARRSINIWIWIALFGVVIFALGQPTLPVLGNILNQSGIGPLTLKDTYILGINYLPQLPSEFWLAATWLGVVGACVIVIWAVLFIRRLIIEIWRKEHSFQMAVALFLVFSTGAYLFPIFATIIFDRYLVTTAPLLLLAVLSIFTDANDEDIPAFRVAGFILVAIFAIFSIGVTKDYLTWNRLRWQAVNDLMETQHVSRDNIDGGFEFNGYYLYNPSYQSVADKSWWWVYGDDYLITFQEVYGYKVVKEYPYRRWLPPYEGKILVSRKSDFSFPAP